MDCKPYRYVLMESTLRNRLKKMMSIKCRMKLVMVNRDLKEPLLKRLVCSNFIECGRLESRSLTDGFVESQRHQIDKLFKILDRPTSKIIVDTHEVRSSAFTNINDKTSRINITKLMNEMSHTSFLTSDQEKLKAMYKMYLFENEHWRARVS